MNNKLKNYIGILLIVNIVFFGVQYYFNYKYINKFQNISKQYSSIQQKEILIFQLKDYISELESKIFSNGIFSLNDTLLRCKNDKIDKMFVKINHNLNILEKGGKVSETTYANLATYSKIDKNLYIQKETNLLYIKDIKATLSMLPKFIKEINKQIMIRNKKISRKNVIKLKYYLKLIPSIIQRTKENVNNYLTLTESRLKLLDEKKKELLYKFFNVHLILFLILIVANFFIFYLVIIDIQTINKELRKRLYYDTLTGLKNRIKLQEELKEGILFILDIDKFGIYNELYGNKRGDLLLNEITKIFLLSDCTNKENLYRIGSDEFAILCKKDIDISKKIEELELLFKNIIIKIDNIKIENISFKVGVSNIRDLLDNAFIALKIAKESNKEYHIFSEDDLVEEQKRIKDGLYWTQKIQNAIDNDLITPVFQPIVNADENLLKYEMLLRIKDGDKLIPPFFLEIAIQNNQYFDISKIMFNKAINYINKKKMQLSFNINYVDIENDEMYKFYENKIKECLYPHCLTIEILESGDIEDYKLLNQRIQIFKDLGVKIAIDDFGSGYSNYKHILELKPDFVKIDGSLIKNILTDKNSFYIVESIQYLAKQTNILIVAEFVENQEIFEKLKEMEIDYFQGYYFSKPIEIT